MGEGSFTDSAQYQVSGGGRCKRLLGLLRSDGPCHPVGEVRLGVERGGVVASLQYLLGCAFCSDGYLYAFGGVVYHIGGCLEVAADNVYYRQVKVIAQTYN